SSLLPFFYFFAFFAVSFLAAARRSVFLRRDARFLTLSLPWLFPIRPPPSPFRGRYQANSLNPFLRSDFRLPISDLWLSPILSSAIRASLSPLHARCSSSPRHPADSGRQSFHPSNRLAKTLDRAGGSPRDRSS